MQTKWLATIGAGFALLLGSMTPSVAQPISETTATGTSTTGLLSITLGQEEFWGDTSGYRYIVAYGWEADRIAEVKRLNPETKVLMYVEAGATQRRGDCSRIKDPDPWQINRASFGVDFCWLLANGHRDWILTDSLGRYAEYADYPGFLAMDMGNRGYAEQWAKDAIYAARTYGFDGVWADDVNTVPGHSLRKVYRTTNGKPRLLKPKAYGAGAVSWTRTVNQAMSGTDIGFAANVYVAPWVKAQARQGLQIAAELDLFNREHQSQWALSYQCGPFAAMYPNDVNAIIRFAQRTQRAGAAYSAIDYGAGPLTDRDRTMMTFGRSMFLLSWDGNPGAAYFYRPCGSVDPADSRWTTELGMPTGKVRTLQTKTFKPKGQRWPHKAKLLVRSFELGIVVQNQLPVAVTVPLDGVYQDQTGQLHVGTITLPGAVPFVAGTRPGKPRVEGTPGSAALLTRVLTPGLHTSH